MAITYVSTSTTCLDAAAASIVVTAPASIQDGDILILSGYEASTNEWLCSGFTQIEGTGSDEHTAFWKRASSESGNYTITRSGGGNLRGGANISVFRGCIASGSPVDVYSSTAYTTSNTICRAAGVTTSEDGCMLVFTGHGGAAPGWTPPSGFDEVCDQGGAEYGENLVVAYDEQASAGASGNKDYTMSGSTTDKHAMLIALLPVAGGAEYPVSGTAASTSGASGAVTAQLLASGTAASVSGASGAATRVPAGPTIAVSQVGDDIMVEWS